MADPEANIIFGTVIDERMGDDLQITVIATGFDAARKGGLYGTAAAHESVAAGLENRDYMQELQRQRTAAGEREGAEGVAEGEAREAVAVPISTGTPVPAGESRASKEIEDLDIPAFLRRSR
jgi:cell division protein FtsZ